MPQKIFLVRHGETDYNKERRMQGWLDIPLNEVGREQARQTASKLVGHTIDYLYSSDLRRAHQTSQHITKTIKKPIVTTTALRERDMGIFAGWAWESDRDANKDQLWLEFEQARNKENMHWNKHGGESLHQMSTRISTFMESLHTIHTGQVVLIVTHGGTINRILEHYHLKSPSEGFKMIANASVLVLHKQTTKYHLTEL